MSADSDPDDQTIVVVESNPKPAHVAPLVAHGVPAQAPGPDVKTDELTPAKAPEMILEGVYPRPPVPTEGQRPTAGLTDLPRAKMSLATVPNTPGPFAQAIEPSTEVGGLTLGALARREETDRTATTAPDALGAEEPIVTGLLIPEGLQDQPVTNTAQLILSPPEPPPEPPTLPPAPPPKLLDLIGPVPLGEEIPRLPSQNSAWIDAGPTRNLAIVNWRDSPAVKNWKPDERDSTGVHPLKLPFEWPKLRYLLALGVGAVLFVVGLAYATADTRTAGPQLPVPIARPPGEVAPIVVEAPPVAAPHVVPSALDLPLPPSPTSALRDPSPPPGARGAKGASSVGALAAIRSSGQTSAARCSVEPETVIDAEAVATKEKGHRMFKVTLAPKRGQGFHVYVARATKCEACVLERTENIGVRIEAFITPDKPTTNPKVIFRVDCGQSSVALEAEVDQKLESVRLREVP